MIMPFCFSPSFSSEIDNIYIVCISYILLIIEITVHFIGLIFLGFFFPFLICITSTSISLLYAVSFHAKQRSSFLVSWESFIFAEFQQPQWNKTKFCSNNFFFWFNSIILPLKFRWIMQYWLICEVRNYWVAGKQNNSTPVWLW